MKVGRRLVLLASAIIAFSSAWFLWFHVWPAEQSVNSLLIHLSWGNISTAPAIFDQITLSGLIFGASFIGIIAAVTGARIITVASATINVLLVILVAVGTNSLNLNLINLDALGLGAILMLLSATISLVMGILPIRHSKIPKK